MGFDPNLLIAMPLLCLTPLAIVFLVLRHRRSMAALRQKAILELLEHGATVPPELLADSSTTREADLRRGLVLSCTGLGAIAFAMTLPSHEEWGFGLLPLFAGLGYLITWRLSKSTESADHHA
jgi:Domain of unknown function (DUF6249)